MIGRTASTIGLLLLSASVARGMIIGEIVSIGFPAVRGLGEGHDLVRPGQWMPVVVRLTLENQDSFDGWIRISQPDKDGDRGYDMQSVHLRRDQTRTYRLYAVAGKPTGRPSFFSVEVLSNDNRRVELISAGERTRALLPLQSPDALTAEDYLILSVGYTVGKVALLEGPDQADKFSKMIRVGHIAPDELPTRWQGLQIVDAVVWDHADPTVLTGLQLDALLEWTRQGGLLVIAAGTTADTLAQRIPRILPVDLGKTQSTVALPRFRQLMLSFERGTHFSSPIVVATCTTKPGATTIVAEDEPEFKFKSTLVARRRLARGRVVFVAAALSDLLGEEGNSPAFFKRILELRSFKPRSVFEAKSLAAELDGWVGFKQIGATYLAVAMIFAVIYVFAATLGSWQFLRGRGWLRHSWSAFAVVAVAASVLSVAGVQAVRGVGTKLVQLTVVDAEAGESMARATAYFGLKTSRFVSLDVWLPHDYPQVVEPEPTACVLHPLPPSTAYATAQHYADPGSYSVRPSYAELLGVPIRGTLKQFEGRWAGWMPGRLQADLRITGGGPGGRYDWRITPDSTIVNALGVDLYRTFLIYAAQDVFPVATSVEDVSNRADKIYLFDLGELPQGATIRPGATLYLDQAGNEAEFKQWSDNDLDTALKDWAKAMGSFSIRELTGGDGKWVGMQRHEMALMLLSMLAEFEPPEPTLGFGRIGGESFTAGSCRHLDLSALVDTRTALFIGFARADGPVTLCSRSGSGDYARVPPTEALTMYRILIPLG